MFLSKARCRSKNSMTHEEAKHDDMPQRARPAEEETEKEEEERSGERGEVTMGVVLIETKQQGRWRHK